MKKKRPSDRRAKLVEEAMRLTWFSLRSHMYHTYQGKEKSWDKACIRKYARTMVILADLY